MRIWDLSPSRLCRSHLLGEHRELHAIWAVPTQNKKEYPRHPETLRWKGKLAALYQRHHALAGGSKIQTALVDSLLRQRLLLRSKGCGCRV